MKKILFLSDNEKEITSSLLKQLKSLNKQEEVKTVENNRNALIELAKSISLYPSILGTHHLGKISRSIETLVEMLCRDEDSDIMLHIPTKALLGRDYTIAKINFFFMLLYLSKESFDDNSFEPEIKNMISNNVFNLMAEEVFLSIIKEKGTPKHIRTNAGYLIAKIWEYRLDHGVKEFAPILTNLWEARKKIKPAYGTMLGLSELFKITKDTDSEWIDFILRDNITDEEVLSLEEFLMGISYEEITKLRVEMEKRNINSINREKMEEIIGSKSSYPQYGDQDPRDLYRSFINRKINAGFRSRARLKGPKKTIEEYIMIFLLPRPENTIQ